MRITSTLMLLGYKGKARIAEEKGMEETGIGLNRL